MTTATALPATDELAWIARDVHATWTSDPEMPATAGSVDDAVKVMAVRAAVYALTRDERAAALPAPAAVELSALMLAQFPGLRAVAERTGHPFLAGDGGAWEPGGYLHRAYAEAFGPAAGRHWRA